MPNYITNFASLYWNIDIYSSMDLAFLLEVLFLKSLYFYDYTVDPWLIQVYLYVDFFFSSKYNSTTRSAVEFKDAEGQVSFITENSGTRKMRTKYRSVTIDHICIWNLTFYLFLKNLNENLL